MEAEKHFIKELKSIARGLDVVWSKTMKVWCIFFTNPDGRTYKVHEVRDDDGNYMQLDNRTLDLLRRWDCARNHDDADIIVKKQYEAFCKQRLNKALDRSREKHYKGKQMIPFWSRVATKMLDNKQYLSGKNKWRMMRNIRKAKLLNEQTADLFMKLGLPHLTGKAQMINSQPLTGGIK